jgi:hypothetical protein
MRRGGPSSTGREVTLAESRTHRTFTGLASALGLTAILATAAAPAAEACSCVQTLNVSHPCESYHERSVVFLGRALEEPEVRRDSGGWGRRIYRFAVEESFHGVAGPTVEVVTGMGGGDCGVDFEVGRLTFVHAWHAQSGDEIVVGLCGTNSTRDLDGPDVAYARALVGGDPRIAIFGQVTRQADERGRLHPDDQGLAGVAISIDGPGGETLSATTDRDGRFEIPGPLQGRYAVRAELPGDAAPLPEQKVEVVGERCQGVEFVLSPSGP